MKILLVLSLLLQYSNLNSQNINAKCKKMADKANTDTGFRLMYKVCEREDTLSDSSVFNRSKMYKCAKKAYKKKSEPSVSITYKVCMNKN